jgi:hypothetical protein
MADSNKTAIRDPQKVLGLKIAQHMEQVRSSKSGLIRRHVLKGILAEYHDLVESCSFTEIGVLKLIDNELKRFSHHQIASKQIPLPGLNPKVWYVNKDPITKETIYIHSDDMDADAYDNYIEILENNEENAAHKLNDAKVKREHLTHIGWGKDRSLKFSQMGLSLAALNNGLT